MSQESKEVDPTKETGKFADVDATTSKASGKKPAAESEGESGSEAEDVAGQAAAPAEGGGAKKKKKKSKKSKGKEIATEGGSAQDAIPSAKDTLSAISKLSSKQIRDLLTLNPALLTHLQAQSGSSGDLSEEFKKLNLQEIMTGMATSGKNVKDVGEWKFWSTQPVPQFGDEKKELFEEGPLRVQKVEDIPTEPEKLALEQFRWVTMDLTNPEEMAEVQKILDLHYVEDDEAMFRLKYSKAILKWSLMTPGYKKDWHVGIRSGNALCAFISAIPVDIRVRDKVLRSSEVNFLCVHKKLRGKRLAPVLIKEITRRINLEGIWQAIYTGGVVLPKPVSTCRYYHRALDWGKLHEVKFSPLPPGTKVSTMLRKFKLPDDTATKGLREMQVKDIDAVQSLLERYLKRFDMCMLFNQEEIKHWFMDASDPGERVIWTYVVEDDNGKITDMFSFYRLESSVIQSTKHSSLRAAYIFYYATEAGLTTPVDKAALKQRLNQLMNDALILAKGFKFDVFNGLSLMDNALFLADQKFGAGDGQLHFYLFNYKANPIRGGVDARNLLDEQNLSGVGFVPL